MPENGREALHLLQDDAELRADHAQAVVLLLRAPHADCAARRRELGVVRYEEALLVDAAAAAPVIQLEVARDHGLAGPALEHQAALIAEAHFTGDQRREVAHHFGRDVWPRLDEEAAEWSAVHLHVEVEDGEGRRQRLHGERSGRHGCRLRRQRLQRRIEGEQRGGAVLDGAAATYRRAVQAGRQRGRLYRDELDVAVLLQALALLLLLLLLLGDDVARVQLRHAVVGQKEDRIVEGRAVGLRLRQLLAHAGVGRVQVVQHVPYEAEVEDDVRVADERVHATLHVHLLAFGLQLVLLDDQVRVEQLHVAQLVVAGQVGLGAVEEAACLVHLRNDDLPVLQVGLDERLQRDARLVHLQ